MKDIAFYYPGHIWHETDQIKSMLLFFDGIGVLIPEYKLGEPENRDPVLAGPLRDRDLLHYFVADKVIDAAATEELAAAMERVISSGALDALLKVDAAFHSLSMSRLGYGGNPMRSLTENACSNESEHIPKQASPWTESSRSASSSISRIAE